MPERVAASTTTSSPTPARARRFARPDRCRGSSRSSRRSTSWRTQLDMDPLALRDKIDTQRHRRCARAQGRAAHRRRAVRLVAAPAAGRRRRAGQTRHRHGAVAVGVHRSTAPPPAKCGFSGDGSVDAFTGAQDIGTGTRTVMAQVVAEEFGLARRGRRRAHRRFAVSGRPAVGRQPRHRLADAGRAQRRLPRRARPGRAARAVARAPSRTRSSFEDGRVLRARPRRSAA